MVRVLDPSSLFRTCFLLDARMLDLRFLLGDVYGSCVLGGWEGVYNRNQEFTEGTVSFGLSIWVELGRGHFREGAQVRHNVAPFLEVPCYCRIRFEPLDKAGDP